MTVTCSEGSHIRSSQSNQQFHVGQSSVVSHVID